MLLHVWAASSRTLSGSPDGPRQGPERCHCRRIKYGDKFLGPVSRRSCRWGISTHLARPRVVSPSTEKDEMVTLQLLPCVQIRVVSSVAHIS